MLIFQDNNKAQVSAEFITMFAVVLIIFMGLFLISNSQSRAVQDADVRISMQNVCNEFAAAVNAVSNGGSGFSAALELPSRINGQNYTLLPSGKTITLSMDSKAVFCRIVTSNVSPVSLNKTNITILNQNGTIVFQ